MQILTRATIRGMTNVRLVGADTNEIVTAAIALQRAEDANMDLVLVSDQSNPPVVRVQDFNKLQYEKKKSKKTSTARRSEMKEVQFKANIADHDFQTKVANIIKFLDRGDKVKIVVRLKGRERENPQRAKEIIKRVVETVPCKYSSVPGPIEMAVLEPVKTKS